MERNGDVVAELNQCNTFNYSLLNNSYNSDKYKMCKDDIVTPLFCSASNCLSKSLIMGSEHNSDDRYLDEKIFRDYAANNDFNMPVIESSLDSICDSPIWEKPPILQSFSPIKVETLKPKNNFINGNKLNSSVDLYKNLSLSSVEDFNVSNNNDIDRKLLLDYEAETSSSSSTEELESCPDLKDDNCALNEIDSNHNIKSPVAQDFDGDINVPKLNEIKKDDSDAPAKNDRAMPELIPSLICLDDDDDDADKLPVAENKKEEYEVINVADSPEMPTLIPFTSERDELFQVKTECISEDDEIVKPDEADSCDNTDEMYQPQVLLRRLSENIISKDVKTNILSAFIHNNCYKPVIDGPEIEEIEGVRFFQFRSKLDMEEFNRNIVKIEADEDMIVPTKTTDITQIKGWRTKFFAPESEFHDLSDEHASFDEMKTEESNQEDKVTANHLNESENKSNEKKELHSEAPTSETKKSPTSTKCKAEESSEDKNDHLGDSSSDSEEDEKKARFKQVKDEGNKNKLSAFVSEELDKYLLNSSTLNVSFLQKVNPNIIPIPKDAKILSIGKLRKTDNPPLRPHLVFKRKSNSFKIEKIENDSIESITLEDSPASSNVITLDESSDESDEDIPVAALVRSKRAVVIKRENSKGCKRNLESENEASAKRVVLRLTKEGSGVSKGYKVSDISCKNEKSLSTSRASSPLSSTSLSDSPEDIEIPANGTLPIIKKTLFTEKNEKRLVNEFLNNLNMFVTRKDVAMLVQSNQSFFENGPTLSKTICARAVSVLVSNKEYFEEKQKTKKKVKSWQKYLPKKDDKENVKMKLTKRKSRIDMLLSDAENMIPPERGKRSIRLPARYLDSAVLAASEWVSPVVTVGDSGPVKIKEEPVDDPDKINDDKNIIVPVSPPSSTESSSSSSAQSSSSSEDIVDKSPIILPQKRSVKTKKAQIKKKKLKDSPNKPSTKVDTKKSVNKTNKISRTGSSPIDSSDEDVAESLECKNDARVVNKKPTAGKKKKNEAAPTNNSDSVVKTSTEKVSAVKRSKSKANEVQEIVLDSSPEVTVTTTKVADESNKRNKTIYPYPRVYPLPDCACKHSARTVIFDYSFKQFSCAFCDSMKKVVFRATNKKTETNSLDMHAKDDQKSESCAVMKQESNIRINASTNLDSIKLPNEKTELPETQKSQLNISDISTSIPISFANQLLKQESKTQATIQNVTSPSSSVPSNSAANKYILLLQPVKTAANANLLQPAKTAANAVPILPVRRDLTTLVKGNQSPASTNVVTNSLYFNNKSKPPILIRKTSTGLVTQNAPSEFNSLASNSLSKMAEKASSQLSNSLTCDTNDRTSQSLANSNSKFISNANNSPISPPVVTAYKLGENFFICNTRMSSNEPKTVIASNALSTAQVKPITGPVITSVKSVQREEEEKSEQIMLQNEITEPSQEVVNNHHNYHRQRQNRRKSPLTKLNYTDNGYKKEDENIEVDIETVDDSCDVLIQKKIIKVDESDSDISDNECASIFLSSADKLRSVYAKKSVKERQRRLQIKSGFEALKQSSRWFKNANTWIEILNMAVTVVNAQQKSDKMFNLAKKRLKVHNSMLMGKLARLMEGVEESVRDQTKLQIIRALALDQDKYQNKKSVLPLLSEGYRGCAFSSDTERKNSKLDPPDMGVVVENAQDVPSQPMFETNAPVPENTIPSLQPAILEVRSLERNEIEDSHSVQDISSDECQTIDTKSTPDKSKQDDEIILDSPKDYNNVTPGDSTERNLEGLKQKVKEALDKKEESSGSDTEELGSDNLNLSGFSDDDFDDQIVIKEDKKENAGNLSSDSFNMEGFSDDDLTDIKVSTGDKTENTKSSTAENTGETSAKEFPGLIPLFHPKVLKQHLSPSQSPVPPESSSHRAHSTPKRIPSAAPGTVTEEIQIDDDDDDDEVAILDSSTAPSSLSGKWGNSSAKDEAELSLAAKTANKLFGPCTVQKVQLKNGQTVFAYNPRRESLEAADGASTSTDKSTPALQTTSNGIRNLTELFSSVFNKNNKRAAAVNRKRVCAPEEIVLSDSSDEETTEAPKSDRTANDSSLSKKGDQKDKNNDEPNQGGKGDSPSSSL